MIKKSLIVFFIAAPLLITALLLYPIFVIWPVSLYTEAKCLEQGYPDHAVTITLDRYCMNLAGFVTTAVVPQ